jgi:hypothetical protein
MVLHQLLNGALGVARANTSVGVSPEGLLLLLLLLLLQKQMSRTFRTTTTTVCYLTFLQYVNTHKTQRTFHMLSVSKEQGQLLRLEEKHLSSQDALCQQDNTVQQPLEFSQVGLIGLGGAERHNCALLQR